MTFKEFIDALSKWSPIKIENNFYLGKNVIPIRDSKILIDNREIDVKENKEGKLTIDVDGTEVERFIKNKKENIRKLDTEEQVFTRADIVEPQIETFNVDKEHEAVIKKLKPILSTHLYNNDLGALLSASTLIKVEDKKQNLDIVKQIDKNLSIGYGHRGRMIYNLFRSNILQIEVLNYLNKLKEMFRGKPEEIRTHFLLYWDTIIANGYPTAYFVTKEDTEDRLSEEIKTRLDRGNKCIRIYSRVQSRNKNTEKWCKKFAQDNQCNCKAPKAYQLGFTPAVRFTIIKRAITPSS